MAFQKTIPNSVLCWLIYTTARILFNEKVLETVTVHENWCSSQESEVKYMNSDYFTNSSLIVVFK